MKTIVEVSSGLSKYLLDDSIYLEVTPTEITVGEPPEFIIGDLSSANATVYENVIAPDDWFGNKYTFNGTEWAVNPNWVEPIPRAQS